MALFAESTALSPPLAAPAVTATSTTSSYPPAPAAPSTAAPSVPAPATSLPPAVTTPSMPLAPTKTKKVCTLLLVLSKYLSLNGTAYLSFDSSIYVVLHHNKARQDSHSLFT